MEPGPLNVLNRRNPERNGRLQKGCHMMDGMMGMGAGMLIWEIVGVLLIVLLVVLIAKLLQK